MKKLMIFLAALTISLTAFSQDYTRNGKTFETVTTKSSSQGTKTDYTWKTKDGKEYPIYLSSTGAAYIMRISSKTGKEYKYYLPKEVAQTIVKEIGFKPKNNEK